MKRSILVRRILTLAFVVVLAYAVLSMDFVLSALALYRMRSQASSAVGGPYVPLPTATWAQPAPTFMPPIQPIPTRTTRPTVTPTSTPTPRVDPLQVLLSVPVPERDLYSLAARLKGVPTPIPRVVTTAPAERKVGDRETFWVSNQDAKAYFRVTAVLRYVTDHVYMWVQEGLEVDEAALKRSADVFEKQIYPTNRRLFGSEWTPGVDGDPHLHVLNARGFGQGVAGYYSSSDEYPREVDPFSNEREMFYINVDTLQPGTREYESVLAHEFQHMIQWYQDPNESTWVNEGAAELAAALNGYDDRRFTATFTRNPDIQLNAWGEAPGRSAPHYGAAYLFMTYFLNRVGPEAVRALIATPEDGILGYERVLAQFQPEMHFDDLFADWLVANYLDDPQLEDGRYGYRDLQVRAQPAQTMTTFPALRKDTVHQYAADYIVLRPDTPGDLRVRFQGDPTTRLTPNRPHSGRYHWWSNRADGANTTLTRAFDLSQVQTATLEVWLWYDIEEDWDYAYVEVSTDGGQTWETLPGRFTTTENPNGNSFGHAWTGRSGAATPSAPSIWVQERVDLTPYAGQKILLRFEYITDDALNGPGLTIDDIRIPELGYYDDVESGDGGWIAEGFVRTDNVLPQRWLVQVIEQGAETRVRRIPVGPDGQAEFNITGVGDRIDQAVIVVSAVTPKTTETASYTLEVEAY